MAAHRAPLFTLFVLLPRNDGVAYTVPMKVLNVRNLPDDLHARLRLRAAGNGRSMEAEVREILRETLKPGDSARAVRELQTMARKLYGPRRKVVDEFIAERRQEAAREESRWSSSTRRRSSR